MSVHALNIGQFQTGGHVGSHPTILIGTLFVENIGLLDTPQTYRFEAEKVQEKIICSSLACKICGVPVVVELSAKTEEAVLKQIAFLVEKTDCSFIVQSITKNIKIAGLELASSSNALERTLYRLKVADVLDHEIQRLTEIKPAAIIVELEKLENNSIDNALKQVEQLKALLPADLHSTIILWIEFKERNALKATCEIGQQLRKMTGHPIAGSPFAAMSNWEELKLKGPSSYFSALASTIGFYTAYGFDLLFIGPLQHLTHLSTAQGVVDIYNRSALMNKNCDDEFSECHPIHELL